MRGAERVTRAARGKTAMFGAGSFATLNFLPQIFAHGVGCKEFLKEFTVFSPKRSVKIGRATCGRRREGLREWVWGCVVTMRLKKRVPEGCGSRYLGALFHVHHSQASTSKSGREAADARKKYRLGKSRFWPARDIGAKRVYRRVVVPGRQVLERTDKTRKTASYFHGAAWQGTPRAVTMDVGATTVTVCARFRPENDIEREAKGQKAVSFAEAWETRTVKCEKSSPLVERTAARRRDGAAASLMRRRRRIYENTHVSSRHEVYHTPLGTQRIV